MIQIQITPKVMNTLNHHTNIQYSITLNLNILS